jgi:hypothetical protein
MEEASAMQYPQFGPAPIGNIGADLNMQKAQAKRQNQIASTQQKNQQIQSSQTLPFSQNPAQKNTDKTENKKNPTPTQIDKKTARQAGTQMTLSKLAKFAKDAKNLKGKGEEAVDKAIRKGTQVAVQAGTKALEAAGFGWVAYLLKGIFFGVKNIIQILNRSLSGDPQNYFITSAFFIGPYTIFYACIVIFSFLSPLNMIIGLIAGMLFGSFFGMVFHKQLGAIVEELGNLHIKDKIKGAATGGAKK